MRLLILGTGGMANNHATYFSQIPGVELVAAVDVDDVVVRGFALRHNIPLSFTSLDDAIAWGEFDAAANVTPDAIHHPTSLKLLAAGKHVFCEKPLAENYAKAAEMADAAEKAGLVAMVNLTYRNVAPCRRRARWYWPARSARCGIWKPPISRAGSFPRPGATG